MDIEELARAAGSEAWDIWRDSRGALWISLDGVSLAEELEKFAELVAESEREACKLRCAATPVLIPGNHEYTALRVQQMMMDAIAMHSNVELRGRADSGEAPLERRVRTRRNDGY